MNKTQPIRWIYFLTLLASAFVSSCHSADQEPQNNSVADTSNFVWEQVRANKRLRVLTDYNTINYYIYRGEPMGYQYELLKAFCAYMDLRLDLKIVNDLGEATKSLQKGETDMVAMNMTVTGERMRVFDFSDPIIITKQVLVQRLPRNWLQLKTRDQIEKSLIRSSLELAKKTVYVQQGTVFAKRLHTLADEIGDTIIVVEDPREVEELMNAVASRAIEYTVADEHLAKVFARNHSNLDIKMPLSFDQKIAWVLKKENDQTLLKEVNAWLSSFLPSMEGRLLYDKYFSPLVRNYSQSEYHSLSGNRLSPYDDYIRKAAASIGWDWRLMASLIYQESEFKPNVRSWAGAFGLMQLMPGVMEQFEIDTTATPEVQILVGAQYLQYLDRQIPETVTDSAERIMFVLAAYNAGVGHLLDARRLATKYNKDPNIWTNQVDFFIRNKSKPSFYNDPVVYYGYMRGDETYQFVEEIMERYNHYRNLIGLHAVHENEIQK